MESKRFCFVAHFGEVYIAVFQSSILAVCPLNTEWMQPHHEFRKKCCSLKFHLFTPHFGIMFALLPISLLPISPSTGPKHFHGFSTNRASRRHRHKPSRQLQRVPSTARRPMCSSPLQEGRITKEPMWKLPKKTNE